MPVMPILAPARPSEAPVRVSPEFLAECNSKDRVPWLSVDKELETLLQEIQTLRNYMHDVAVSTASKDITETPALKSDDKGQDSDAPEGDTSNSETQLTN